MSGLFIIIMLIAFAASRHRMRGSLFMTLLIFAVFCMISPLLGIGIALAPFIFRILAIVFAIRLFWYAFR